MLHARRGGKTNSVQGRPKHQGRTKLLHLTTVASTMNFFRGQIEYLKGVGFDVTLASSPGPVLSAMAEQGGADACAVEMRRDIAPWEDILSLGRILRLLIKIRPDIVHAHTPKAGFLGCIAARLLGVRAIFLSVFGLPQMTKTGVMKSLLNLATRLACSSAHRVWCDSQSMSEYLVSMGLCPADKVFVIRSGSVNGVDSRTAFNPSRWESEGRSVRARLGIGSEALVLGFVGRVAKDKGIHELVDAWQILRMKFPSAHMIIVGPEEKLDPILSDDSIALRGDNKIHLVGRQVEVQPYFAAMNVFVMPSYREGFGVTNIEAAAMGLPVVSTSIPGCIDSVQDGITGILVAPRDSQALCTAIERYFQDRSLRALHGKRGRTRTLQHFQPLSIWEGLAHEYRRFLEKNESDCELIGNKLPMVEARTKRQ
jgi:glycosyltransferase involved in cell wall biosynthesis